MLQEHRKPPSTFLLLFLYLFLAVSFGFEQSEPTPRRKALIVMIEKPFYFVESMAYATEQNSISSHLVSYCFKLDRRLDLKAHFSM